MSNMSDHCPKSPDGQHSFAPTLLGRPDRHWVQVLGVCMDCHARGTMIVQNRVSVHWRREKDNDIIPDLAGPGVGTRLDPDESGWVALADRLPDRDGDYLVRAVSDELHEPFLHLAQFDPEDGWTIDHADVVVRAITHWMSIPVPPEED